MASNAITTIPVHSDVVRRLRSLKTADQTWDDLLLEMAEDYVPRFWVEELERRARDAAADDVPAEVVFRKSEKVRTPRRRP